MEKLSPKIQVIPGKLRFSPVLLEHPISNHLQGQILFNHDLQQKTLPEAQRTQGIDSIS